MEVINMIYVSAESGMRFDDELLIRNKDELLICRRNELVPENPRVQRNGIEGCRSSLYVFILHGQDSTRLCRVLLYKAFVFKSLYVAVYGRSGLDIQGGADLSYCRRIAFFGYRLFHIIKDLVLSEFTFLHDYLLHLY